jgi:DNA adenine methylase
MWAGGKTKVLKHYGPFMPSGVDNYYESFFGGGAMFIHMMNKYKPKNVFINDINKDIVSIYRCIKENYDEFIQRLDELEDQYIPLCKEDRKKLYFEVRHHHAYDYELWPKPFESATLYFLMKTGFNGVYQLNKNTNGRYGTPAGLLTQKTEVYDRNIVLWWHHALQNATITSQDWENHVKDDPNAFFFFDPPYRSSFADYGNAFDDDALLRLIDFCDRQDKVFLANRADDDWFDGKCKSLNTHYFNITYTAGRRKKTEDGYTAKSAREILLYKTNAVPPEQLAQQPSNPLIDLL